MKLLIIKSNVKILFKHFTASHVEIEITLRCTRLLKTWYSMSMPLTAETEQ